MCVDAEHEASAFSNEVKDVSANFPSTFPSLPLYGSHILTDQSLTVCDLFIKCFFVSISPVFFPRDKVDFLYAVIIS